MNGLVYVLKLEDGCDWYFSTEELAEDAAEFFELDEDEYEIIATERFDDATMIRKFIRGNFKPEKYK